MYTFSYDYSENGLVIYKFKVNSWTYNVGFRKELKDLNITFNPDNTLEIFYWRHDGRYKQHLMTKDMEFKSIPIFRTIIEIIKTHIKNEKNIDTLIFKIDHREKTREKLYGNVCKRFKPIIKKIHTYKTNKHIIYIVKLNRKNTI